MSWLPLLQILHVDQAFFKYNGIKTYNCIVSDSFGSQAAQIVGLPPKFSKKQKLPIIAVIRYKIEVGIQDNLVILEFDILANEVDAILGNPNHKFIVLNNQANNAINEYLNGYKNQRKVDKALKLEQQKEKRKETLSIRELNPFNITKNSVLKAKVLDVSDLKTFSKDGSFGEYFTIQLIDKNGDQIMAVVFNNEELKEEIQIGDIYEFKDFNVKEQTSKYQYLQTPYSIILKNTTKISQIVDVIKPQGCTIAQAKLKPLGSFINLIAFIQVECDIENQAGWHKDKSRKQMVLKDQTGIILLNIWQTDRDIQTFGNKIIAISNLKISNYNNVLQLNSTDSSEFNYNDDDLKDEPQYQNLIKISKEFKIDVNSNSQQLLQEMLGIKLEEGEVKQDNQPDFYNVGQQLYNRYQSFQHEFKQQQNYMPQFQNKKDYYKKQQHSRVGQFQEAQLQQQKKQQKKDKKRRNKYYMQYDYY